MTFHEPQKQCEIATTSSFIQLRNFLLDSRLLKILHFLDFASHKRFTSISITSSTLSLPPGLFLSQKFRILLSRWKIFQVAHFAQKVVFRFRLNMQSEKGSLMSLGIKRVDVFDYGQDNVCSKEACRCLHSRRSQKIPRDRDKEELKSSMLDCFKRNEHRLSLTLQQFIPFRSSWLL